MYFCNTQIGISKRRATKFQIHKKSPTNKIDSRTIQKKKIIVKWKSIQANPIKIQALYKLFSFILFSSLSIVTKLLINFD
jgi:hypothetical protein